MDGSLFVDQWRMQHSTNERSSIIAQFFFYNFVCVCVGSACVRFVFVGRGFAMLQCVLRSEMINRLFMYELRMRIT